jgi:glutaconate CoA-transferase subunit A
MVTAARRVILTAERIVAGQTFIEQPELTTIAGFMVDMVVEAPHGAWPCSCAGLYDYDAGYLAEYTAQSRNLNMWQEFLRRKIGRLEDWGLNQPSNLPTFQPSSRRPPVGNLPK